MCSRVGEKHEKMKDVILLYRWQTESVKCWRGSQEDIELKTINKIVKSLKADLSDPKTISGKQMLSDMTCPPKKC